MSSPQWGKPGAAELQPTAARLVLPDLLVTQDKTGKSQVLNAGNYLTFLRSKMKATPVQMKHSTYHLPVATSAWAFSNIFIKNNSWFQLLLPVFHLSMSLFVLLLTFWFIRVCNKYEMHAYCVCQALRWGENIQWCGRQTLMYIKDDFISFVLGLRSISKTTVTWLGRLSPPAWSPLISLKWGSTDIYLGALKSMFKHHSSDIHSPSLPSGVRTNSAWNARPSETNFTRICSHSHDIPLVVLVSRQGGPWSHSNTPRNFPGTLNQIWALFSETPWHLNILCDTCSYLTSREARY